MANKPLPKLPKGFVVDKEPPKGFVLDEIAQAGSKITGIRQRPPLRERIIGRVQAGLPSAGQFIGGTAGTLAGSRVGAPVRGGIVGGTTGRMLGRFGQLAISQFQEDPRKFITQVMNPLAKEGGAGAIIRNVTPEQRQFLVKEFSGTVLSESLFAGLGVVGKRAIKGVAGELLGQRVSERGFEVGFKQLTDPKFRTGRVPKQIAMKAGQFFKRLKDVLGKNVGKAVNRKGVGDQVVSSEIIDQGLNIIEKDLGQVDELGVLVSPAQKKLIKEVVNSIKKKVSKDPLTGIRKKGMTIADLWETRRNKIDRIKFGKGFSPEGEEYLNRIRSLINTPIKQASPEIVENFRNYSSFIDIEEGLGKKFNTITFAGKEFAPEPEKFAGTLLKTAKDEQMSLLREMDGFLQSNDRVMEDLLNMAGAEELSKKIGAVTLGGKITAGLLGGREATARLLQIGQTAPAVLGRRAIGRAIPTGASELAFPGQLRGDQQQGGF